MFYRAGFRNLVFMKNRKPVSIKKITRFLAKNRVIFLVRFWVNRFLKIIYNIVYISFS